MSVKDAVVLRIEQILMERRMAKNELANLCGMTPSTVYSFMDSARKDITISTIKKVCDGLEMTLQEFFTDPIFDRLDQEIK